MSSSLPPGLGGVAAVTMASSGSLPGLPMMFVPPEPEKSTYDKYFLILDVDHDGVIGASEVGGLRATGLGDQQLGYVWGQAVPQGCTFMSKESFYLAMRIIACLQNHQSVDPSMLRSPSAFPLAAFKGPSSSRMFLNQLPCLSLIPYFKILIIVNLKK